MECEIDEDLLYYFPRPMDDEYCTLFVGWMLPDLVEALLYMEQGCVAQVKLKVGENTLCALRMKK